MNEPERKQPVEGLPAITIPLDGWTPLRPIVDNYPAQMIRIEARIPSNPFYSWSCFYTQGLVSPGYSEEAHRRSKVATLKFLLNPTKCPSPKGTYVLPHLLFGVMKRNLHLRAYPNAAGP